MSDQIKSGKGCFVFFAVLAGLLAVAKLLGVLHWSWLWVLSPLWGPVAVMGVIVVMTLAYVLWMERGDSK